MTAGSLFDFFREQIDQALFGESLELSEDTRLYLAALLAERARPRDDELERTATLVELHARAQGKPPAEQARAYRELGDRALYVVGYFSESLERRIVGPSYYEEMGAAAYQQVDRVFRKWFADAFGPVFRELSGRFKGCVGVLREVRRSQDSRPDALTVLYEKWLATGDEADAARLRRMGLLVRVPEA